MNFPIKTLILAMFSLLVISKSYCQNLQEVFLIEEIRFKEIDIATSLKMALSSSIMKDTSCLYETEEDYVLVGSWFDDKGSIILSVEQLPLSLVCGRDYFYCKINEYNCIFEKEIPKNLYLETSREKCIKYKKYYTLDKKTLELTENINPETFYRWDFIYENKEIKLIYNTCK